MTALASKVEAQPWTTGHDLSVHNQIESRPGPAQEDGITWADNRSTGMVHVLCNCGYSSGWIPRQEMPSFEQLRAAHGTRPEATAT